MTSKILKMLMSRKLKTGSTQSTRDAREKVRSWKRTYWRNWPALSLLRTWINRLWWAQGKVCSSTTPVDWHVVSNLYSTSLLLSTYQRNPRSQRFRVWWSKQLPASRLRRVSIIACLLAFSLSRMSRRMMTEERQTQISWVRIRVLKSLSKPRTRSDRTVMIGLPWECLSQAPWLALRLNSNLLP